MARVVARLLNELRKASQELSGGLLEVTREVKDSIQETHADIVHEGQKIVDDLKESVNPGEPEKSQMDEPEVTRLDSKKADSHE